MTKPEAVELLKKIEYKYIAHGLLFSDFFTYKDENYSILMECQKDLKELKIYTDIKKFRLIIKI